MMRLSFMRGLEFLILYGFKIAQKQQMYGHLPPISKTIQISRARHVGHYWRSKGKLISNALLWTPSHRQARLGRPDRTY